MCTLAGNGEGTSRDSPTANTAAFYWPASVALYPPHSILVVAYLEHRLRVIHHNGTISTLAGSGPLGEVGSYVDSDNPLAAGFFKPVGVCVDSEGNILLCDLFNHRIRTILRNGTVRTLAGSATSGYVDSADPLEAKFFYPHGIASIVENNLRLIFVGGYYDHRIRVIYANRTVSTLAGSGGTGESNCDSQDSVNPLAARFCCPAGVAADRFGNVVVAEIFGNRVRKVWRDGTQSGVTTVAGHGPISLSGASIDSDNPLEASLFSPIDVGFDGADNILVSCVYEHRVRMVYVNGSVRTLAGSGPSILEATTPGGFLDNVPLLQAKFFHPEYFVIEQQGNVIIADNDNNRVRMLCTELSVGSTSSPSLTPFPATLSASATTRSGASSMSPAMSRTASYRPEASNTAATPSHTRSSPNASFSSTRSLRLLSQPAHNPISGLVSSEAAARAIVASGTAAAALAGFAATTSMGHATRMASLMRSVECAFTAGELDSPSLVELPLQWNMDPQSGSVGSHAGSALFTSALLVVLPLLMCAVAHAILSSCGVSERPVLRSLQRSVLSQYCLLSMAFLAPNVLMSSVVVVGRGASGGVVAAAVCAAIVPLLLGCVAGQRALAMDVDIVPLSGGKWQLQNRSSCAYVETFGVLVSGCRDPVPYIVRVCFLEDVVVSLMLSLLSGVSLSTARCEWVALAMLVVCAFHLLYIVSVHPLRSALESAMYYGLCGVQVLMAALCVAIAYGADNSNGVLMSALGVVAVVQNASFFVQAGVLAACACVSESQKKHAADTGDTSMMTPMHSFALLSAPEVNHLPLTSAA